MGRYTIGYNQLFFRLVANDWLAPSRTMLSLIRPKSIAWLTFSYDPVNSWSSSFSASVTWPRSVCVKLSTKFPSLLWNNACPSLDHRINDCPPIFLHQPFPYAIHLMIVFMMVWVLMYIQAACCSRNASTASTPTSSWSRGCFLNTASRKNSRAYHMTLASIPVYKCGSV